MRTAWSATTGIKVLARRLDNGNLLIPVRLEDDEGLLGDGAQEIAPNHLDHAARLAEVVEAEARRGDGPPAPGSLPSDTGIPPE